MKSPQSASNVFVLRRFHRALAPSTSLMTPSIHSYFYPCLHPSGLARGPCHPCGPQRPARLCLHLSLSLSYQVGPFYNYNVHDTCGPFSSYTSLAAFICHEAKALWRSLLPPVQAKASSPLLYSHLFCFHLQPPSPPPRATLSTSLRASQTEEDPLDSISPSLCRPLHGFLRPFTKAFRSPLRRLCSDPSDTSMGL